MQPNWIDQLSDKPRRALESAMIQRNYPNGAMIYGRDELSPGLFVIRSGSALFCLDAANGRRLLLRIVRANELFGETVASDGQPAPIAVEAREELSVSMIPMPKLFQLKLEFPAIAVALADVLTFYTRALLDVLIEQALLPIEQRVSARLALLCRAGVDEGPEPDTFLLEQSQSELAMMLGATRQSVNSVLGRLEASGAITRRFRAIEVRPALLPLAS
jgi:CRP/FNR family cyclic AMP-dependent transcriptional regulator